MPTPMQQTLFGGPPVPADIPGRVRAILQAYPGARNDYKELIARYWLEYDGLAAVLGDKAGAFLEFMRRDGTTSPKTVQNRAMEIQRQDRSLDAAPAVRRVRNAQATQGAVR